MSEAIQYIVIFGVMGMIMLAVMAKANRDSSNYKSPSSRGHSFCFKKTFREDSETFTTTSDEYQKI